MLEKLAFDHSSLPSRVLAAFLAVVLAVGLTTIPPYAKGDGEETLGVQEFTQSSQADDASSQTDDADNGSEQGSAQATASSEIEAEASIASNNNIEQVTVAESEDTGSNAVADSEDASSGNEADVADEEEEIVPIENAVAYIGEQGYKTLAEAFAVAKKGTTIKLANSVELNSSIVVSNDVTLDVVGNVVDAGSGTAFEVASGATFTLKDSKMSAPPIRNYDGVLIYNSGGVKSSGTPIVVSGGDLVVESGTVLSSGASAVSATSGGSVVLREGMIETTPGSDAVVSLSGGSKFTDTYGGAVYGAGSTLVKTSTSTDSVTISAGTFILGEDGGKIISGEGSASVTGGLFVNADPSDYLGEGCAYNPRSGMVQAASFTVSILANTTYNGSAQAPSLRVMLNGSLVNSSDYTVAYSLDGKSIEHPVDAGTYSVTVTYEDKTATASYTISPRSIESAKVADKPYVGAGSIDPETAVLNLEGDTQLVLRSGEDFTASDVSQNAETGVVSATLTGKGNYTGTANVSYRIVKHELVASMVSLSATELFIGSNRLVPGVTVADSNYTFVEGTDYMVSYHNAEGGEIAEANITEAGSYSVVVSATETGNLTGGSVTIPFTVSTAVADIDGVLYSSLEAAYEAANAGDAINLLADVTLDKTFAIDKNITLKLGENKVTYSGEGYAFEVAAGARLALNGGEVNLEDTAKGAVSAGDNASVTVTGGTYTAYTGSNVATFNLAGAKATFEGATITASNGSCVLVSGGNAAATFTGPNNVLSARGDTAQNSDCAIAVDGGTVTVNDGKYSGSFAVVFGKDGGVATLKGGAFTGTTLSVDATASIDAQLVISGGTFTKELLPLTGANVKISGGTFVLCSNAENYVLDGYAWQLKETDTYEVKPGVSVAKVGDTSYSSLQFAIDAAVKSKRDVELLANVKLTKSLDVAGSVTIVGTNSNEAASQFTVTATTSEPLFALSGSANLQLQDVKLEAEKGALFLVDPAGNAFVVADDKTSFAASGEAVAIAAGFVDASGTTVAYLPLDIEKHLSFTANSARTDALASTGAYTDAADGYAQSGGLVFEQGKLVGLAVASVGSVKYTTFNSAVNAAKSASDSVIELCANVDASSYMMQAGEVLKVKLGAFAFVPPAAPAGSYVKSTYDDKTKVTTYTVGSAVACINDSDYYSSLHEAISAAKANDYVTLLDDYTETEQLTVDEDIVLDLGGYTLTTAVAEGVTASGSGVLEITKGTISASGEDVLTANGGTIVLGKDLTVTAEDSVIYADNSGAVVVNGANVTSTSAQHNAAFASGRGSTIDIKAGSITQGGDKTVVSIKKGANFKLEGGTVAAAGNNTAVTVAESAKATVTGGAISAKGEPVAVFVDNGGSFEMSGGSLVAEKREALCVLDAGSSAAISGESVLKGPGATVVAVHNSAQATVSGGNIENTAAGYAVRAGSTAAGSAGSVIISGGIFASANGNAIGTEYDGSAIEVSGGWFSNTVDTAFCAAEYLPVYKAGFDPSEINATVPDGVYYTVQKGDAVAKNGGKQYASLADAVADAANRDTVELLKDTTETAQVKPSMVSVTVDLKGHEVTTGVDNAFAASGGSAAQLTLKNGTIIATGKDALYTNAGIMNLEEGLTVKANETALYASNNGVINLNGATVTSTVSNDFAATAQQGGTINVTTGSLSSDNAGALSVINNGKASIAGGSLSSNNKKNSPVVNVDGNSKLAVSGGTIAGNTVVAVAARDGEVAISGGTITSGTWGAVATFGDTNGNPAVTITGGTITSTDKQYGAAVYAGTGTINISGNETTITGGLNKDALLAGNGSISMSSGWVSNPVPAAYCATGYMPVYESGNDGTTPVEGRDNYYTVKIGSAVAQVETKDGDITVYERLAAAMADAPSGSTVTLLGEDVLQASEASIAISEGRALVLDLAGNQLTSQQTTLFNISKGSLTVKDSGETAGSIKATGEAFRVNGKSSTSADNVVLTINEGVNVSSSDDCCVFVYGKATVTTAGNLKSEGDYCTIQGNGNASSAGTVLNITGGSVEHPSEVAVYVPQQCSITVSGDASIKGATALYVKSGTVSIEGNAKLHGTGEAADYSYNGNGVNATGDAFVIDNCNYPGGVPEVSITGGTFTSTNASGVASYAKDSLEPLGGFISGGWFNKRVSDEYCASSVLSGIESNADGLWTVVPYLDSIKNAEEAAAAVKASAPKATWAEVIKASYYYQVAQKAAAADNLSTIAKATYAERLAVVKSTLESINELDLSNKSIAENGFYSGTDIGSLAVYTGLERLNLANTGITGDTGALASLTKLESLDLSGNASLTTLGGIAALTKLETLKLASLDLDNNAFGPIVALSNLKSLDLSGNSKITAIGPLTTLGAGAETCALSLEELNVSGTGLSDMNVFWNESAPSLPELKTLAAKDLTLDSMTGLSNVALAYEGFSASGKIWDLGESVLMGDPNNEIDQVKAVFDDATDARFIPPTVPAVMLKSNNKGYESIAAAMKDAADDDTIVLFADREESLSLGSGKLTLDLGGYALTLSAGESVVASSKSQLTLKNGKVIAPATDQAIKASGGTVVLDGDLVVDAQRGTAVYAENGGVINVNDARVVSSAAVSATAIATGNGSAIVLACSDKTSDEGLQYGLASTASSQALQVLNGATATINGGKIENGDAKNDTNVALITISGSGSALEMTGGVATIAGTASVLRVDAGAQASLVGGSIDSSSGNAIVVDGNGSKITVASEAEVQAGETGVYVKNGAAAVIAGGTVVSTSERSSALSVDDKNTASSITVSGGWFSSPVLDDFCKTGYAAVHVAGYVPETDSYADNHKSHYTVSSHTYEVKFYDEAGETVLYQQTVGYGATPAYAGATPTKEATAQYMYEFAGWDPEVKPITPGANTEFRATFTPTLRAYDITFVNDDGTELQSGSVAYGETPAYTGETPTRAGDAAATYTFAGWDTAIVPVTGEATYKATYSSEVKRYTVTWVNYDNTVLETDENVAYGTTPSYNGETPVRPADAENAYTFSGWGTVSSVTGDVTYKAQFEATKNTYEITFKDEDGTVLDTQNVEYGRVPYYAGKVLNKEATTQYTYQFAGWEPDLVSVTGEATYTATYQSALRSYDITFANDDGTVLERKAVAYGDTPVYTGTTPAKAGDAQYSYTFAGWDKEIAAVTGEATYTAAFDAKVNTYTITFFDEDGKTVLARQSVAYGETPVYEGTTPTKVGDAQYSYAFAGWDKELAAVGGSASYTATYKETLNTYTVTFYDEDGKTVLDEQTVAYGAIPAYEGEPTKAGTAQYGYTFTGWDKELVAVTGDASYTATYDQYTMTYTITWTNEDGTVLDTQTLAYGETPVYGGATPTKTGDASHAYSFARWSPDTATVTGKTSFVPIFDHVILPSGNTVTLDANSSTSLSVDATQAVRWSSSNTRVATVDANGVVTAVGPGTARITVTTANGTSLSYVVTVKDSVELSADSLSLVEGETSQLTALVNGAQNPTGATWTSSNSAVAMVGANGTVTAVAPGTAVITITYNGVSDTCRVTVTEGANNNNSNGASGASNSGNGNSNGNANGNGNSNNVANGAGNENNAGNGAGGNTNAGGTTRAATDAANVGDATAAAPETIDDDATALAATPAAPETIEDDANALAGGDSLVYKSGLAFDLWGNWWPLFWLLTMLVLGGLLFFLLAKRRKDDEEEEEQDQMMQQAQTV